MVSFDIPDWLVDPNPTQAVALGVAAWYALALPVLRFTPLGAFLVRKAMMRPGGVWLFSPLAAVLALGFAGIGLVNKIAGGSFAWLDEAPAKSTPPAGTPADNLTAEGLPKGHLSAQDPDPTTDHLVRWAEYHNEMERQRIQLRWLKDAYLELKDLATRGVPTTVDVSTAGPSLRSATLLESLAVRVQKLEDAPTLDGDFKLLSDRVREVEVEWRKQGEARTAITARLNGLDAAFTRLRDGSQELSTSDSIIREMIQGVVLATHEQFEKLNACVADLRKQLEINAGAATSRLAVMSDRLGAMDTRLVAAEPRPPAAGATTLSSVTGKDGMVIAPGDTAVNSVRPTLGERRVVKVDVFQGEPRVWFDGQGSGDSWAPAKDCVLTRKAAPGPETRPDLWVPLASAEKLVDQTRPAGGAA